MALRQSLFVVLLSSLVVAMEDKPKPWSDQYRAVPRVDFELRLTELIDCHVTLPTPAQHINTEEETRILFEAVKANDIEKVKELLALDIDVNPVDEEGGTPVYFAARNSYMQLTQLLIAAGAILRFPGKKL